MQGMHGKQCCHEKTGPHLPGAKLQQQKQENTIDDMEEKASQMGASGIQPKNLTVQHMGEPGQGVPVGRVPGGEGPGEAIPGEPIFDHGIMNDESQIIENKLMISHLGKNNNGQQDQNQAD